MKNWIKQNQFLVVIVCVSFLASLFYSFFYQILPMVDAKAYHAIAVNIVEGNGFRESSVGDILYDRSIQRAGPAYEYFLAGLYWIFGIHYEVVWVAQAFLHAISTGLLYGIAKKIFSEKNTQIGLLAATFFGLHPDLIEISAMIMTETFYLFLTILTVYFFVRLFEKNDWFNTSALAISLALGILARPPLILFIPIIIFFFVIKKSWVNIILFMVLLMSCLTPWTVRNYQIYEQFIPTTLIGEYNLWVGNTLQADGGQLAGGYNPFDEHAAKYGYVGIHEAASGAFKEFITNHPGRFLELCLIRTVRYLSLIRPMGFWFYQSGVPQLIFVALSGLAIAGLFVLGLTGLIKMYQSKDERLQYLVALAATAPLLLLATVVQSRYRFQIYPFLALGAGYAIMCFVKTKRFWCDKSFVFSLSFLSLMTIVDGLFSVSIIWERIKNFF